MGADFSIYNYTVNINNDDHLPATIISLIFMEEFIVTHHLVIKIIIIVM